MGAAQHIRLSAGGRGSRAPGVRGLPTVSTEDGTIVAAALDLAEKKMDFADALHLGKSTHCGGFVTFDRKFVNAAKAAGQDSVRVA